jgi:hypothetical protein
VPATRLPVTLRRPAATRSRRKHPTQSHDPKTPLTTQPLKAHSSTTRSVWGPVTRRRGSCHQPDSAVGRCVCSTLGTSSVHTCRGEPPQVPSTACSCLPCHSSQTIPPAHSRHTAGPCAASSHPYGTSLSPPSPMHQPLSYAVVWCLAHILVTLFGCAMSPLVAPPAIQPLVTHTSCTACYCRHPQQLPGCLKVGWCAAPSEPQHQQRLPVMLQ